MTHSYPARRDADLELRSLQKKIDRVCQSAGTAPDQRAYLPHITLARLNRASGPVHDFLSLHAGLSSEPFVLDQFGLFESELGRRSEERRVGKECVRTCRFRWSSYH